MENKEIIEILKAFSSLNIEELEIKNKEFEIKLSKSKDISEIIKNLPFQYLNTNFNNEKGFNSNNIATEQNQEITHRKPNEQIVQGLTDEKDKLEKGIEIITSPIVGTFYEAPAPGKPPFVKIGDEIVKGQVLCIIEAMKVMNKIESEVEGKVIEKLVKNEQPVEFGTPLFKIKIK